MSQNKKLFFGGDIYTFDSDSGQAGAVAVQDGIIAAVGAPDECRAALGGGFEEIDLGGRALLPGFIDTHTHPVMLVYFDMNLNLRGTGSIGELQEKLRAEAAGKESAGEWVVGLQFDEQYLAEQRMPSRAELDAACPGNPLVIMKSDGHTALANTEAMRRAGIDTNTKDPAGGSIDREPGGMPAGVFRESAAKLALEALPVPEMDAFMRGSAAAFGRLAAHGITSIGGILQTGGEGPAGESGNFDMPLMQMMLEHIPQNVYSLLIARDEAPLLDALKTPLHSNRPGGHTVGGIKIFADGTLGSCTAFMEEPFADYPDKKGFMVLEPEEIYSRMEAAHKSGFQIAIHSIGDASTRVCLELYDRLLREYPRAGHRHRIEHASVVNPQLLAEMKRLGILISSQPAFIDSEKGWTEKRVGSGRLEWTYAYRQTLDAGVRLAGSSDAPLESTNVMKAVQCCVTRCGIGAQAKLSVGEALKMFTIEAAYAQFEEDVKGSITPGRRADLVILGRSPFETAPEALHEIEVSATYCGGEMIYESQG